MKVLLLDTVHGGKILADRYLAKGCEVTAVDVYKITPKDVLRGMAHKGVRILDEPPAEDFDLCVMPCHCPDMYIGQARCAKVMWTSHAVHELFDPYDNRFRIEITGVKGKTSTCYVLAHILDAAGKRTFLHTSRGMGPYAKGQHVITDFQSIAPSTLLNLPRTEYEVLVCEVSLGGSGRADIAGITNLLENYGIAKNSRKAEDGKKDILTDRINVVPESEKDIWAKYGKPIRTYGRRLKVIGAPEFGKPLKVEADYRGTRQIELKGTYLALQYLDAMSMAMEICDVMDIPQDIVLGALASFPGVPGRGQISVEDGVRIVKDRNPGISHMSVERTLSCLKEMGALDGAVLIVDPVSKKVCDKMDSDLISGVASRYGVDIIITDGSGEEPEIPKDRKTVVMMVKEGYQ
ncbi:UDP-N-acetylmuramoylalanine-D-glutamate ligase [Thermoplasmatales archaeon BRNA1]|nr:UDP-N-acetylmuramoylalanine-D-glutamate ligase [Thermoplasmatales archaeon BRNA1]